FLDDRTWDMAALQVMLESKPVGLRSRSTLRRTRRHDGELRDLARVTAASIPDEPTRAEIHRRWRWGFSVEVLARQYELSRSRIERLINERRAQRLLEAKLEFMSDPAFDDPAAVAEILGPSPEPAVGQGSRRARTPHDLPPYLASLYDVPLLSRE